MDDHTCRHSRYRPSDTMVFFTSDRAGAAYGVVQNADGSQWQPDKYAPDRVVALDDGLWRGSGLCPNASARADRVAVRVRFALGGSKMAGPKIAHVDMLAGCM